MFTRPWLIGFCTAAMGCLFSLHVDVRAQPDSTSRTRIVLLGTGTPSPDPERSGPATAIVVNATPYLIDFGPGVVRRIAAAAQKGVPGLSVLLILYHRANPGGVGRPNPEEVLLEELRAHYAGRVVTGHDLDVY